MNLSDFEQHFVIFCRKRCTQSCDTMKLDRSETRSEVLVKTCPILQLEQYAADKKGIEINLPETVKRITTSNLYKKILL